MSFLLLVFLVLVVQSLMFVYDERTSYIADLVKWELLFIILIFC